MGTVLVMGRRPMVARRRPGPDRLQLAGVDLALMLDLVCAGIADGGLPLEDENDLVTLYRSLVDLGATPQPRVVRRPARGAV